MIRLADYFQTSIDHLVGRVQPNCELSVSEGRLLAQYRRLSKKQQECVALLVQSYLE